jgi:hypothetical protein
MSVTGVSPVDAETTPAIVGRLNPKAVSGRRSSAR